MEAMMLVPGPAPAGTGRIFSFTGASNTGYYFGVNNNGQLYGQVANGTSTAALSPTVVPYGQPVYVAVTWNGTTVAVWINAVSKGTASLVGGNTDNPARDCFIGSNGSNRPFPGWVQEIRVSNIARTPAIPTSPFTADANTVGLWHLNEGSGSTVNDASGNGLTGTFSATAPAPLWVPGYLSGTPGRRYVTTTARQVAGTRTLAGTRTTVP
jgi:hypothetical protein